MSRRLILHVRRRPGVTGLSSLSLSACPPGTRDGCWQLGDQCWLQQLAVCGPDLLRAVGGGGTTTIPWSGCALVAQWHSVVSGEGCSCTGHSLQVLQQNDGAKVKSLIAINEAKNTHNTPAMCSICTKQLKFACSVNNFQAIFAIFSLIIQKKAEPGKFLTDCLYPVFFVFFFSKVWMYSNF